MENEKWKTILLKLSGKVLGRPPIADSARTEAVEDLLEGACSYLLQCNHDWSTATSKETDAYLFAVLLTANFMGKYMENCQGFLASYLETCKLIFHCVVKCLEKPALEAPFSKDKVIGVLEGLCDGKTCLDRDELIASLDKLDQILALPVSKRADLRQKTKKATLWQVFSKLGQESSELEKMDQKEEWFLSHARPHDEELKTYIRDWNVALLCKLHVADIFLTQISKDPALASLEQKAKDYMKKEGSASCMISKQEFDVAVSHLKLINSMLELSIFVPSNGSQLELLASLVTNCIHASLAILFSYKSNCLTMEGETSEKRKPLDVNFEDIQRSNTWKSVKTSMEILDTALLITGRLLTTDGNPCNNLKVMSASIILNGLCTILQGNIIKLEFRRGKRFETQLKWYEVLNISLGSFITKAFTLIMSLLNDLKLRELDIKITTGYTSPEEITISSNCTWPDYVVFLFGKMKLPTVLWSIFVGLYDRAKTLSDALRQSVAAKAVSTTKRRERLSSSSSASEEDSSEDEGSVLGQWLERTLATSTPSPEEQEMNQTREDAGKIDQTCNQSVEILTELAGVILDLSVKTYSAALEHSASAVLQESLNDAFLKSLGNIVLESHLLRTNLKGMETLYFSLPRFLSIVLKEGVLSDTKLETLLEVVNMSPGSKTQLEFPVNSLACFLCATVVLKEQAISLSAVGHGDNARANRLWRMTLKWVEESINDTSDSYIHGLNREFCQILLVFWHNFSLNEKIRIFTECIKIMLTASRVSRPKSYMSIYRLVTIFDYMLFSFIKPSSELVLQVAKNILNVQTHDDENTKQRPEDKLHCPAQEHFLEELSRLDDRDGGSRDWTLSPIFYNLRIHSPDSPISTEVNDILQDLDNDGVSYREFYNSILKMMVLLFDALSQEFDNQISLIVNLIAIESSFSLLWNVLNGIPPTPDTLLSLTEPSKIGEDLRGMIVFLKFGTKFIAKSKNPIIITMSTIDILDRSRMTLKEKRAIAEKLCTGCHNLGYFCELSGRLVDELLNTEFENVSSLLLNDASLVFVLNCIKEFRMFESAGGPECDPSPLLMKLTAALKRCTDIAKAIIFSWTKDKKESSVDIDQEIYSLVIDAGTVPLAKKTNVWALAPALPAHLSDAIEKWQGIKLRQFEVAEDKEENFMGGQRTLINNIVLEQLVPNTFDGTKFDPVGILKHVIRTLLSFVEFLCMSTKVDIQEACKKHLIEVLVGFSTSPIMEACHDLVNDTMELLVQPLQEERVQEILQYHILTICNGILKVEREKQSSSSDREGVLIECLKFMKCVLDKPSGHQYFMEFYADKTEDFRNTIVMARNAEFSNAYVMEILHIAVKVLKSDKENKDGVVIPALLDFFLCGGEAVKEWLIRTLTLPIEEGDKVGVGHLLKQLLEFASQRESANLHNVLICCLDACGEILDNICTKPVKCTSLAQFVDILPQIAIHSGENGHITLIRKFVSWTTLLGEWFANAEKGKIDSVSLLCAKETCQVMLDYLHQVMSCLKSLQNDSGLERDHIGHSLTPAIYHSEPYVIDEVDEEESLGEESDDEALGNMLCTFTVTQKEFMNQHWYHCHTCKMNDGVGCCTICAKICHKDHDVTYAKFGSFFCDCGAKDDGSCKALTKRSPGTVVDKSTPSMGPFSSLSKSTGGKVERAINIPADPRPIIRTLRAEDVLPVISGRTLEGTGHTKEEKMVHSLQHHKDEILYCLKEADAVPKLITVLERLVDFHSSFQKNQTCTFGSSLKLKETISELHSRDKAVHSSENLMVLSGSIGGVTENVRLNFGEEQGQTVRQLLSAHVLFHSSLALMRLHKESSWNLVVCHEKGRITTLHVSGLDKQEESGGKVSLSQVSTAVVPFTVLSVSSNQANEGTLAVSGLKDCHVLTFNNSKAVENHLALPLHLETGNFVIRAVWLHGSQTCLAILTADFVKVFDLSVSLTTPQYHFILPSGKVRDVTFSHLDGKLSILVMSSHGHIYVEGLDSATSAVAGPFYLTNVMTCNHPSIVDNGGQICEGGVSVYFSHALQILLFSYSNGKNFIGVPKKDLSEMTKIFQVTNVLSSSSALCLWREVDGHPGLFNCRLQTSGNPAVVMVTTDTVLVQEIKNTNGRTKIQDAVCFRCPHGLQRRDNQSNAEAETAMVYLLEDGTFKISYTENESVKFWLDLQSFYQRMKIQDGVIKPPKPSAKEQSHTPHWGVGAFPIDFFEHCQQSNDVEFGGKDLLHVYNSQQIKQRLNTAGMYIANTKPSGFKVEVTNSNPSNVMVGVRIHVGIRSLESAPKYLEVFGRTVQLQMDRNRWFDIPFTKSEALNADKKITITFGPSSDPSGVSFVDSIKIYTKTKEAFGWTDEQSKQTQRMPESGGSAKSSNTKERFKDRTVNNIDSLLSQAVEAICASMRQFPLTTDSKEYQSILKMASYLLTIQFSPLLNQKGSQLLSGVFRSKEEFTNKQDELQLYHAIKILESSWETISMGSDCLDVDAICYFLNVCKSVGRAAPKNLVHYVEEFWNKDFILEVILSALLTFYSSQPVSSLLAPVYVQGCDNLLNMIESVTEVLFTWILGKPEATSQITEILIKLLLNEDASVCFATKRGLSQGLQYHNKYFVLIKSRSPTTPTPSTELSQDERDKGSVDVTNGLELPVLPEVARSDNESLLDVEEVEVLDIAEEIMEPDDSLQEPEEIQEILQNPDDDAVLEMAIALSLRDSGSPTEDESRDRWLPSPQIYQRETQFQSLAQADMGIATQSKGTDTDKENTDEESPILLSDREKDDDTVRDTMLDAVISNILTEFTDHIPDLKNLSGMRTIPYLQILLILCSNLKENEENKQYLKKVVISCAEQLQLKEEESAKFPERSKSNEVFLILMRFLSVLMSRHGSSAVKQSDKNGRQLKDAERKGSLSSFCVQVGSLLVEQGTVPLCLQLLKILLNYWKAHKADQQGGTTSSDGGNTLLKNAPRHILLDTSPFFLKQYVKSHASDLFQDFPQLVTEMLLRLPYQIWKFFSESKKQSFDEKWINLLCEYLMISQAPLIRRQVRKLLLALCGSKEHYRYVKDAYTLASNIEAVRSIFQGSLPVSRVIISYERAVALTDHLKMCLDIATNRIENWQAFCQQDNSVLKFLLEVSYMFSEEIAAIAIQLLSQAFSKRKEPLIDGPRSKKAQSKDVASRLIASFFNQCYDDCLGNFTKYLLMESDSKSLRWKARDLLLILYRNVPPHKQMQLVQLMWRIYEQMPELGQRAEQFVDLMGFFTVKTNGIEAEVDRFAVSVVQHLKTATDQLLNHPNAVLYEELQEIVDLDGYYVESTPCFTCNFPEIMFTNLKLSAVKSDLRYLTTAQLVKLNATYNISKLILRISDVKRTRMVKSMNVYYNNKAVQSVIELKNKRDMWQLAKRVNLTPAQTDVKVEFSLPIVACNIMIEYSDFYDNLQLSAETLQCPRCSASVLANPGVCSNCGENVYQCHKCRAINYDERDPFLCTSCGFCKYGKFEYTLVARPCCSVEPIADEEDRQKALDSINSLLEQADKIYNQISNHKAAIIDLLGKMDLDAVEAIQVTNFGKTVQTGSGVTSAVGNNVKKTIQSIAAKYCSDCKLAFEEFSKLLQRITALRWELASYDANVENNTTAEIPSNPYLSKLPMTHKQLLAGPFKDEDRKHSEGTMSSGVCYGCTLSTVEHCLTVLKALALLPSARQVMLDEGVMKTILQCSAQNKDGVRSLTYKLLMILMKDNKIATCQFTRLLEDSIDENLEDQLDDYRMNFKLQNKFTVLQKSLSMYDSCWEERLRCVFKLFLKVVHFPSPRTFSVISLPCVKIILDVVKCVAVETSQPRQTESKGKIQAMKWIEENPHHTFECWNKAEASSPTQSEDYLAEKYGHLWLQKMEDRKKDKTVSVESDTWLSALLFTPFSKELRQTVCSVVENICQNQGKLLQVIQILTRYLDFIHIAEDHASEFLNLYKDLITKSEWKWHLATLGILEKIASLLAEHIEHLDQRENSVSLFGLSQGFAVHSLAELLRIFFADDKVRQEYSNKLISQVLQNYLTLRRLVLQRTKLVDGAQEILLGLIEQLTSGHEEEEESFITVCVNVLKQCSLKDIRTPVFLFERICSIIHKEEKEDKEFLMIIEKDSQQEDYLQGRMQGNPYNCKEPGLGPLMRDIKNKICTECELVALLEDDTGMELLVNNKIVSLDLPVVDVYKKIWCHKGERPDPMKIVYRMRGLLGDATEDIVENLDNDREKDVDEEYDYRRASVMRANGGIDLILMRLSNVSNLSREQKLLAIILKLLEYCVKVKTNRYYLSQPSVRALEIMLGTVNMALRQERDQGSNVGGAATAERLLKLMEKILYEASTLEDQPSHVFAPLPVLPDDESQLDVLLGHITSPYVRSNPSLLQAVMKLIPFFSFGSEQSMYSLIDHFLPYLDFDRLDAEHSVDEKLYLECFCVIAGGISRSAHGSKLKGLINSRGITSRAIDYLKKNIPSKSYRASGILDTAKWKEFLGYPVLPYVLRLLTGLATGHSETQDIIGTNENVLIFHMLEQVSSDEMVGSLAENLLEALSEHLDVRSRIKAARKETREEKRRMAMMMRQKQLDALGLTVNDSGQIKAKVSPLIKEIDQVSDEKGLVCCICREGYEFHPSKILGVYTYTSRCILDEFENKPKKTQGYNTVSHFNVVHLDCHSEAVRHACSRDEWESATLQNGSAKCNGILPIWGPKVSESAFATSLARYNSYIQDSTGFREPTLYSVVHDIRLLLALFAEEKSFSDRIGGGGKNSNMYLIPYMAHLALYVLNTTHQRLSEENVLMAFADAKEEKWIESAYELEGPMFMAVFSWFILPLPVWQKRRITFLKRLLLVSHIRKLSPEFTNSLKDATVLDYQVYKPACIYFILVDQFHAMFKKKVKLDSDDWAVDMSTKMRNNDEGLLKSCEELLQMYELELLPSESFAEFVDVAGLHSDVPEPEKFIEDLLVSIQNRSSA